MPGDDRSAVQAGVDVKVMLTRRLAQAFGDDSAIVDFDDLCDRIKAERGQAASCHVFECRNDRTADSPYCPAHTQITELLAAAPSLPVDRHTMDAIVLESWAPFGPGSPVLQERRARMARAAVDALLSAGALRARDSSREAGQPAPQDGYMCKCPGSGTLAHVRGCDHHPEAGQP